MRSVIQLILLISASVSFSIQSQAQFTDKFPYQKGYFRNPLDVPMDLSGNFGELRANHYHMGLDLRTLKRENLRVYAAAEGYIAKVKIEPAGFGRAIYINHPNGVTTVYCHLNDFAPYLDQYVKELQYKSESWRLMPDFPPTLFPVKKDEFLALSGNIGGSQAPHLHFELRKTDTDVNLNPMLFGFPLPDNTNPSITRLALYDRTRSIYEQAPRILPIKKTGSSYQTVQPIISSNRTRISFAISATDTHSGSTNPNGIFEATIYDNGSAVTGFQMNNISYNDTRYLNAHIDYRTKATGGPYLQHLSELPGYLNSIYSRFSGDGAIDISDKAIHDIRIVVKDAYGNSSVLECKVQYTGGQNMVEKPGEKMYFPLMLDGFESEECEFFIGERTLYDSVHISYRKSAATNPAAFSNVHTIGQTYIPLQDSMVIRIKPNKPIDAATADKTVIQRFAGTKTDVFRAEWKNGWASGKFRDFGSFNLIHDNIPPVITAIGITDGANLSKASRIAFTVSDNLGKFSSFRAELDGKWLMFTNDKGRTFIYKFDEKCSQGNHQLVVSVKDEAGNYTRKVYQFTR